ncbi:hypothetical protein ARTHRO9V_210211 [Arthrobacter sp. 9V]|nr:hypothetical protein ARTHRO9V_210211 [Arthrobacter sp. 9V]
MPPGSHLQPDHLSHHHPFPASLAHITAAFEQRSLTQVGERCWFSPALVCGPVRSQTPDDGGPHQRAFANGGKVWV